eukprot:CAMPEP_0201656518 /NCGR_PEP_ID=MMETSP0493-20130528/46567_1 /ASSEMBLY_ACC=CAM_ASM_000838 /TAXON_ID=420259 /ORGANISM="Thalassiosira gravida, Strain GMp14c1" /LENGTH=63 /DNA_ID=CAMNT_0048133133 /DNA_START=1153 /DNA_END=1345 /DNA_ORIENTATION=-
MTTTADYNGGSIDVCGPKSCIEEANANFTAALVDGDVEKQTELAGLMTRLGEAAVTNWDLERL